MKFGFIGLGVMGGPMAGHLSRAGHDIHQFYAKLQTRGYGRLDRSSVIKLVSER